MGFAQGPSDLTLAAIAGYLVLANILAYLAYRSSVRRLASDGSHMPVGVLVTLAVLGGALGETIASLRVSKVLRRYPLRVTLRVIFVGQIAVIAAFSTPLAPYLAQHVDAATQQMAGPLAQLGLGPQSEQSLPQRIGPREITGVEVLGWSQHNRSQRGAFGRKANGSINFVPARR